MPLPYYLCSVVKKFTIAILMILYVITTSGVVVNIHYCMGAIASVGYGVHMHDEACDNCGMTDKEGCCHTEYKVVKVEDDHQLSYAALPLLQTDAAPLEELPQLKTAPSYLLPTTALQYHSPPDQRANAVFLHNCVFRI